MGNIPNHLASNPTAVSLWKMRQLAIVERDQETVIALGWSLIRIGDELLAAKYTAASPRTQELLRGK